ncbi:MAG: glycoside hydrolase family 3 protein [Candidatus Saccharibacteria bacterium]|nr:glycoside hydrolase family 3 protein [Candidatus Saccharibacteria bacterium]
MKRIRPIRKFLNLLVKIIPVLLIGFFIIPKIITLTSPPSPAESPESPETPEQPTETATPEDESVKYLAEKVLKNLTLDQKIGQMLIIRNRYTKMTPEFAAEISDLKPGGYIIFNENITTLAETKKLISDSREKIEAANLITLEDGTTLKIPAFISTDQEGGSVQRLQSVSDYPPEYIPPMSEIDSTDTAYKTGQLLAEECKNIGLNLDFAPVADIFSNPQNTVIGNRAFGTDKNTVADMSTALARGLRDSDIIPVFKHFPGHGDTITDSHQSLPIVTKSLDELEGNELYPFKKAIESGAEMIMVAHIALPNITGDYTPASLSPKIITDLLKTQLNYSGLVITDGLDMGALTNNYSGTKIAIKAVIAGADLLLTPVSPLEAKSAILSAVKDGTISESRIDKSVQKILELKLRRLN